MSNNKHSKQDVENSPHWVEVTWISPLGQVIRGPYEKAAVAYNFNVVDRVFTNTAGAAGYRRGALGRRVIGANSDMKRLGQIRDVKMMCALAWGIRIEEDDSGFV